MSRLRQFSSGLRARRPKPRLVLVIAVLLVLGPPTLLAWAAAVHRIVQKGRAFDVQTITIAAGDSLLFTNEDSFLHQIYVESPALSFESAEQPPSQTVRVDFPAGGTFQVRCHIHPKMLLTVNVR
jgi:plastocyanin